MDPLLKITSIPISVEVVVTRGQFEANEDYPKADLSQPARDTVQIEAQPLTIDLNKPALTDRFTQAPVQGAENVPSDGKEDVLRLAFNGTAAVKTDSYEAQRQFRSIDSVLSDMPRSSVSWADGTLNVQYQASVGSGVSLEDINQSRFIFVPGSIEFVVKELPHVEIEYTGGPMYFPRSADPNYQPPAVDITA